MLYMCVRSIYKLAWQLASLIVVDGKDKIVPPGLMLTPPQLAHLLFGILLAYRVRAICISLFLFVYAYGTGVGTEAGAVVGCEVMCYR